LTPQGAGKYIVRVNKETRTTKINVSADINGTTKPMGGSDFRVKIVPDPAAKIANIKGGYVSRENLMAAGAIIPEMENFDFKLFFKVTEFSFSTTIGGDYISKKTTGNLLSEDMKRILKSARKGQKIYIEHGHKADIINGTKIGRFIGKSFFKVLRICANLPFTLRFYFNRLQKNEELREVRTYKYYKYLRYALNLLKKYDVIILGHTHKMEAHKTYSMDEKKLYINTGACTFGRFQGIVLDTESLDYQAITCSTPQARMLKFIPRKIAGIPWRTNSTTGPYKIATAIS